jgi:hypothetical protein
MANILKETEKARQKLNERSANKFLLRPPFAQGMYLFSMFMIGYYQRVRTTLNLNYDSFMIVQTVVSHTLYHLAKVKKNSSYGNLVTEWEKLTNISHTATEAVSNPTTTNPLKLTISSICLVSALPKETVRRKVSELCKNNLLKNSKKYGIQLGANYKKVFHEFVPKTTTEVARLVKRWKSFGILDALLSFDKEVL